MAAVRETLVRAAALLESLALPGEHARLLVSLNLFEMSLRFVESQAAGVDVVDRKYIGPLTRLASAE